MFLCKSKSGIYYLYFTGLNGKRQKVSTKGYIEMSGPP